MVPLAGLLVSKLVDSNSLVKLSIVAFNVPTHRPSPFFALSEASTTRSSCWTRAFPSSSGPGRVTLAWTLQ